MQYWINHNGVQSGPVDLDGIKEMGLTSRAYVWHEGLADWVKITQLPDLQGFYEMVTEETGQANPASGPAAAGASSEPVMGQPYQPYQPQYTAPAPQIEQPTVQPAANEKDDLDRPIFRLSKNLRRLRQFLLFLRNPIYQGKNEITPS